MEPGPQNDNGTECLANTRANKLIIFCPVSSMVLRELVLINTSKVALAAASLTPLAV